MIVIVRATDLRVSDSVRPLIFSMIQKPLSFAAREQHVLERLSEFHSGGKQFEQFSLRLG